MNEIKRKEDKLRNSPENTTCNKLRFLQQELSILLIRKTEVKLNYAKQRNFEFELNEPGKWLAYKLWKEKENKLILKLQ